MIAFRRTPQTLPAQHVLCPVSAVERAEAVTDEDEAQLLLIACEVPRMDAAHNEISALYRQIHQALAVAYRIALAAWQRAVARIERKR